MPQDAQASKETQLNQLNVIISELNLIAAQVQNDESPKSIALLLKDVAMRIAGLSQNVTGGHNPGNDDSGPSGDGHNPGHDDTAMEKV